MNNLAHPAQLLARDFLNILYHRILLAGAKSKSKPAISRSAGTPNSMNIGLRNIRKVIVDNKTKVLNIKASCRNIRGDYNSCFAAFKILQRSLSCVLRFISVYGLAPNFAFVKSP